MNWNIINDCHSLSAFRNHLLKNSSHLFFQPSRGTSWFLYQQAQFCGNVSALQTDILKMYDFILEKYIELFLKDNQYNIHNIFLFSMFWN